MNTEKTPLEAERQPSCLGAVISRLSDEQIELVANIFSKGNEHLLADMEVEWLLSHAFQLGAKFHRDFTNGL
jgi:hypothetical protein